MFELNVKGTTQFPTLIVGGTITADMAGTSVSSDFEQLQPTSVINNNAEIILFTVDDFITLEYDDRILLRFTPTNPNLTPGLEGFGEYIRNTATVNIIDNDLLEINFDLGGCLYSTVREGSTLDSPIKLQFRSNQNPFTVSFRSVSITNTEEEGVGHFISSAMISPFSRATAGADFSTSLKHVNIPASAGVGMQTITIPEFFSVTNDNVDEDEQSFALIANIGEDVPDRFTCFQTHLRQTGCSGRVGATAVRIEDNDVMKIGFTQRTRMISEGADFIFIALSIERISERGHRMVFRYLESSSAAIVESFSVQENPFFDAVFGTRDSPHDPLEEEQYLIPNTSTIRPLTLNIRNDFIPEEEECFTIEILPVDDPDRREFFTCNESADANNYFCKHTICIEDDDEPFAVAFTETSYTVLESAGSVEVCVNLTQPQTDIIDEYVIANVIDHSTSVYIPSTAALATPDPPDFLSRYLMIEGTDYSQQVEYLNQISINSTSRVVCYNQPIYDDVILENSEYFGLTLGISEASVPAEVKQMYNQAAVLIVDNDRAIVGIEETLYSVSEDVNTVELCAVIYSPVNSCPIEFPISVVFATADLSAVQRLDYEAANAILTFGICDIRKCLEIRIVDDSLGEEEERFSIFLGRTPRLDSRIVLTPVNGEVQIMDNDGPSLEIIVGFSPTKYTAGEGQTTVLLSIAILNHYRTGAPRPFTLSISTQDGTAVSPGDFRAVSDQRLQFNGADAVKHLRIFLTNDEVCETGPRKYFFVNLDIVVGVQPIVRLQRTAEVLLDDASEPECSLVLSFSSERYMGEESSSVSVCVTLSNPLNIALVFVITAVESGTAVAGEDFYSGRVFGTIAAGSTEGCADIAIIDDNVVGERNEGFSVELSTLFLQVTIGTFSAEVTIMDSKAFNCAATAATDVIIVDCEGTSPDMILQCSFNGGLLHSCFVPMVLSINVSPPGTYSLRIVKDAGEEDTVMYNITAEDKANVPPLKVILINGSPHVTGSSVEAEFVTSRPVVGARCYLRSTADRLYKYCSSGRVTFTDLMPGHYVLKIQAYNRGSDVATAKIEVVIA
jgi:hypothetical protein